MFRDLTDPPPAIRGKQYPEIQILSLRVRNGIKYLISIFDSIFIQDYNKNYS